MPDRTALKAKAVAHCTRMVIGLGLLLFAQLAEARAGWTDFGQVAELVPTGRQYYEVRLVVKDNPSGCRNDIWFYQNYDAIGADKMFDILFEGVTGGLKLRVYVTGICNINGYSEISAISIVP